MKKHKQLMDRLEMRVDQYRSSYQTGNQLLYDAVREAAPWVGALYTRRKVPSLPQMETLCAQLLALLTASLPEDIE